MLTRIAIDRELLREALEATGLKDESEVVELALRTLIRFRTQQNLRELRGRPPWQGDLDAMRTDA